MKERLAAIPPSVRARILPGLKQPWSERVRFVASIAKRHGYLYEQLREDEQFRKDGQTGKGWVLEDREGEPSVRKTRIPDALLLLEEEHRLQQETTP